MNNLPWILVLALPLAGLVGLGLRAFDGSVRALDGLLRCWLPRSLAVTVVMSALYLTWR